MITFMFEILLHGGWIGWEQWACRRTNWYYPGPVLAWTRVWVMGNGQALPHR